MNTTDGIAEVALQTCASRSTSRSWLYSHNSICILG